MAQAPKERNKKYRQRIESELRQLPDSTYPFLSEPFHVWLARNEGQGDWGAANYHLDAAGLDDVEISDNAGPKSLSGQVEKMRTADYDPYAGFSGSIGQAEAVIDNLIAAAHCMAMVVARYKLEQIKKKISELEQADLANPDARKKALADIVRLSKIREMLDKQTKVNFPQWQVKGV